MHTVRRCCVVRSSSDRCPQKMIAHVIGGINLMRDDASFLADRLCHIEAKVTELRDIHAEDRREISRLIAINADLEARVADLFCLIDYDADDGDADDGDEADDEEPV